jgi:NAD(P)-dependent dehydrogenase (short-subunit alcohol dehydrogenase family)
MNVVLVTGAGRGLGLEFTRQLVERGDRVFATVRNRARSDELQALGERANGRLHIEQLDVAEPDSIERLRKSVGDQTAKIDCLINNAGINSRGVPEGQGNVRFGALEPTGIERMMRINAIGPVLVTQAFADLLVAAGSAKVVSISSWLGSIGEKNSGGNYGYCASKAALNMLARAMAFDLAPSGITSVVINPGWVSTQMGGPKAKLTPAEAAAGVLRVADGLMSNDAGRFLQWDGSEHAW